MLILQMLIHQIQTINLKTWLIRTETATGDYICYVVPFLHSR